ncbi:MAG: VWA domain-containing protein [Hyphomicrobiales bacterium]|nr:VWA domain-containing protein [Hyphomicrobiales bacterium]MBV9975563.1 VWA domain-containing protein [Hyphomicrobiales bacterium]
MSENHLADNVAYFARALRKAGLPVGPGTVLDALAAIEAAGIGGRDDFYWTLHSVFVTRHEHSPIFEQAFHIFFRRRGLLEKMIAAMSPMAPSLAAERQKQEAGALRVNEALQPKVEREQKRTQETEISTELLASSTELLQAKDFAQMTADEIAEARRRIAALMMPQDAVKTRRFIADPRGARIDPRASFRRSLRSGGAAIELARRRRRVRHPPIVALCDISGSMDDYTRIFLHFLHALMEARGRVQVFLFATRLTNVTRQLRARDPDDALARCGAIVKDWAGGTRIADTLHEFNRDWSRRALWGGPIVLLFTDGLERRVDHDLAFEMDRLHRSCRRLVWLNPLLRYGGFEARAAGIRAMLPHVDEFRPIHNLASLADLCSALALRHPTATDPRRFLATAA